MFVLLPAVVAYINRSYVVHNYVSNIIYLYIFSFLFCFYEYFIYEFSFFALEYKMVATNI